MFFEEQIKMNTIDKAGLSKILLISGSLIEKIWREYPHFFVGQKKTGKSVRFDLNDVIEYLKERDYADSGQKGKEVDRAGALDGASGAIQTRISNKKGSCNMGEETGGDSEGSESPIQEFASLFGLS